MEQTIIVTFHKNPDMLNYCIKRLRATCPVDTQIIIMANNSNSDALKFEVEGNCKILRINRNLQYPKAINYAMQYCQTEIVTFMDADVFVWNGWNEALLQKMTKIENAGALGAKLVNPLNNRILDFGIMYSRFNAAHTMMGLLYDHPLAAYDRKVQAACSAILMTKRSLFREVGGMDEELPDAYTDCDYCFRLRDHGYDTWVVADSIAYHRGSTDTNNSKSAFSYYRADAKGIFGMKDYAKIDCDMEANYKKSAAYFRETYGITARKFLLIDFTTMYDREEYYRYVSEALNLEFLDIRERPCSVRDDKRIILYNTLGFSCIDLTTPVLYFVDTFISLFENRLWFTMRNIENDIVVDRHGNILPLTAIANKIV